MFADTELALKIETAEANLIRNFMHSNANEIDRALIFADAICGGVASFIRPGSPLNKIIGLCLKESIDKKRLEEIENLYFQHSEPVRIELCTLANAEVGRHLTESGYRLHGFENVLGRSLRIDLKPAQTSIEIVQVTKDNIENWAQTMVKGFSHSDETGINVDTFSMTVINQAIRDSILSNDSCRYLAIRNEGVAGGASMFVDGKIALLTGATTLPAYRRLGVQNELLVHRLSVAREQGAEIAVITTAGGSRSQANAVRQGFSLLYSRAILVSDAGIE